ncbi:hypothetical protein HID58_000323, partial [Brassica napus]
SLLKTNLSATTCSFSSSVYSGCWRGPINVGTVVNSARRRHDVGGLLVSGCLSLPDSSSPPSSISGPKTKLYVSDVYVFNSSFGWCLSSDELVNWLCIVLMFCLWFYYVALIPYLMTKGLMYGFAFLRYETEEESLKAIQGMHGKITRCQFLLFELEDLLPSLSLSNLTKCFVETIRNFFAALFLASTGMLINMHFLWNHVDILVAAVLLVIVIKTG